VAFLQFLEIDDKWWDMRAPALVLPGDTMPPLCTRNTLFSPDVFWSLPLLPDYATTSGMHEITKAFERRQSLSFSFCRCIAYLKGFFNFRK